jgi:acetylornithine deacetylase/succinyl-diaminopimelate desuccinylase-like protein
VTSPLWPRSPQTGAERTRADWVDERLAALPGRRVRYAIGNLLWTFGSEPPNVLVLAHLDSVFPKDVELSIRDSDGWLEGPGVRDNACAVAVCMSVVGGLVADHGVQPLAVGFTAEVGEIRERGWAFSWEETYDGAWAVGAPLVDPDKGTAYASIAVAAPTTRHDDQTERAMRDAVLSAARGAARTLN